MNKKLISYFLGPFFMFGTLLPTAAFAGETTRISVSASGEEANSSSSEPAVSNNGHYTAFNSSATNLVAGLGSPANRIFLRNNLTGVVEVVTPTLPSHHPSISDDGRYVGFMKLGSFAQMYRYDSQTQTTETVSLGNSGVPDTGWSISNPLISGDGQFAVFTSPSPNLVAGDTNNQSDVFIRDIQAGTTERVSVSSSGEQGYGSSNAGAVSSDGRYVVFRTGSPLVAGDVNGKIDVFVRDRLTGTTELVSQGSDGTQGTLHSYPADISADGRYIVFYSLSPNFGLPYTGYNNVFVRDRFTATTHPVSIGLSGSTGNGNSNFGSISDDGRYVAFQSFASNLVSGDNNSTPDIFVFDRHNETTSRVSVNNAGVEGNNYSAFVSLSPDGRHVAFNSLADNLVNDDLNGYSDVFLHDRLPSVCY